jgi:hypothetical protein
MSLDGYSLLVGTGFECYREARVIVQHRQRIAIPLCGCGEVPLEIHLPQIIGCTVFKPAPCVRVVRWSERPLQAVVPPEDVSDGIGSRYLHVRVLRSESAVEFTTIPSWVALTLLEYKSFYIRRSAGRRTAGAAGAISQASATFPLETLQPLVCSFGADAKPATQLSDIGSFLTS